MKNLLTLTLLVLALLTVRCKKINSAPNPTNTNTSDGYDAANNIFRIKASSSGVAYKLTIKRSSATNPNGDVQTEDQTTGSAFEEPFTPAIGDSIKIVAQSTTGSVYLYALYKGVQLPGVVISGNGTLAQFNYLVKN